MSDIKNVRIEEDLLGTKEVSNDLYYGVHTLRAVENFKISTQKISDVPEFVRGMVLTKKAAALAKRSGRSPGTNRKLHSLKRAAPVAPVPRRARPAR